MMRAADDGTILTRIAVQTASVAISFDVFIYSLSDHYKKKTSHYNQCVNKRIVLFSLNLSNRLTFAVPILSRNLFTVLVVYFLPDTTFTWILAGYGAVFVATAAFWFGIEFCLKHMKR